MKRTNIIAEDRYLKQLWQQNRQASAPYVKVELEYACAVDIIARTVQMRLTECGLLIYLPKKKDCLLKKCRKTNLLGLKKNMFHGPKPNGDIVIFSDE